jgi:hypothetical protein
MDCFQSFAVREFNFNLIRFGTKWVSHHDVIIFVFGFCMIAAVA